MKKLSRTEKVFYALVNNLRTNGGFMDECSLARQIHGDSYTRRTAHDLEQGIKDVMYNVNRLAIENGFNLVKKRKPTKNDPKKGFLIEGWKLGVKGFDGDCAIDEVNYKLRNAEAVRLSVQTYLNTAKKNELIPSEKCKELETKFNQNIELILDLLTE